MAHAPIGVRCRCSATRRAPAPPARLTLHVAFGIKRLLTACNDSKSSFNCDDGHESCTPQCCHLSSREATLKGSYPKR
eukprot:3976081-Pleurochrysis_carterae.AAC.1